MHLNIILCSVDRASQYNRVNENQLDAQLILSIFRQPLHASGTFRPIINPIQLAQVSQSSTKNNKYQLLYAYECTS